MEKNNLLNPFYDFKEKGARDSRFFFLEHVLKARIDLNMESGRKDYDQEINVYVAGLLYALLINNDSFLQPKAHISAFDVDVRAFIESHPGKRTEYMVYRDNADFGLMILGLFDDFQHRGSYKKRVLSGDDDQGRIALYYELAASALAHLQGSSMSLVSIFDALSQNVSDVLRILRRAAGAYFDMLERMSEGSVFHLQIELDKMDRETLYQKRLDEFLTKFSLYKDNPSETARQEMLAIAEELKKLNSNFSFDSLKT